MIAKNINHGSVILLHIFLQDNNTVMKSIKCYNRGDFYRNVILTYLKLQVKGDINKANEEYKYLQREREKTVYWYRYFGGYIFI